MRVGDGNDLIMDFVDGTDKLGLSGSLTFPQLKIESLGSNTTVRVQNNNEIFATLVGVNPLNIELTDFVVMGYNL